MLVEKYDKYCVKYACQKMHVHLFAKTENQTTKIFPKFFLNVIL